MRYRFLEKFVPGSMRRQLMAGVLIIQAVTMALLVLDMTFRQEKMLIQGQLEQATALTRSLATTSSAWLAARDLAGLQELAEAQRQYPGLSFAILTDDVGHVLAHTDQGKVGLRVADLPAVRRFTVLHQSTMLIDVAAPVTVAGHHVGWARIGLDQRHFFHRITAIKHAGVLYALAAIIVGSLFTWFAGTWMTGRLRSLQDAVAAVKNGDRRARCYLAGRDEAVSLAAEFNTLFDTIEQNEFELKSSENRLRLINANLESLVAERTCELHNSLQLVSQREAQLSNIIEFLPDATFVVDKDMNILAWNRAMEELTGVVKGEMIGQGSRACSVPLYGQQRKQLLDLLDTDDHELEASYQKIQRKGSSLYVETFAPKVYGGTGAHIWAIAAPLYDSTGVRIGAVEVIRDITGRKRMEEELQEAKEAADRANRAKSEFLANMSHEIRTPLNGIQGLSHLLLDTPLSPKQKEYLHKILSSSKSLMRVLNDILDYSKIEAGQMGLEQSPLCIDAVLARVSDLFSVIAGEKGLTLVFEVDPILPDCCVGDELRLGQVLNNLVGNAIKFSGQGEIRIRIEPIEMTETELLLSFSVRDTGIGISEENLGRLFTPFSQADSSTTRRFGGTGLGLSISKRIVGLMGGEISAESEPGKGSTFTFTARFGKGTEVSHGSIDRQDSAVLLSVNLQDHSTAYLLERAKPVQGARILLVEDNVINQLVAQELLKRFGLVVDIACNGLEAVTFVEDNSYDLILMDLQMPVMDGLEATRKIRSGRQGDGVPIIAMTAAVLTQDREACLAVGMNDHIPKPLDLEQLLAALLRWIEPNVPNNHLNKATGALPAAGTDDFTIRYDREVVAGHLRTIRETVEKNRVVPHQIMAELGDLLGGSDVVSQMEMLRKQLDRFSYTEALASVTMIDRILQIDSGD